MQKTLQLLDRDMANESQSGIVRVVYALPGSLNRVWRDRSLHSFISEPQKDYTRTIRHQDPNMTSLYLQSAINHPPILMTEAVLSGLRQQAPAARQ